jgi:hypothetical protein
LSAIQVAWSDDGGETWGSNIVAEIASTSPQAVVVADRQWLGFGRGRTVYLSYSQVPSGLYVLRSDDGGHSFPRFTRAVGTEQRGTIGTAGPVVVAASGRLLLPYFADVTPTNPSSGSVRVALSDDGGTTFTPHDVFRAPSGNGAGAGFPILSLDGRGRAWVAWWGGKSSTMVSTSTDDGERWSGAIDWGPPGAAGWTCPWIATPGTTDVDLLAYAPRSDRKGGWTYDVVFARGRQDEPRGRVGRATIARAVTAFATGNPCNTDFANFAVRPEGGVAIVFVDARHEIYVAEEQRRAG